MYRDADKKELKPNKVTTVTKKDNRTLNQDYWEDWRLDNLHGDPNYPK